MQRVENDRSVEAELSDGQYRVLENSWISYVQSEREKEGMKLIDLAHRRTKCDCGKSRTSYPHWPPSCRSEAVDQLCCLLGRSYPHREYLAKCWLTSISKTGTGRDRRNGSDDHLGPEQLSSAAKRW